MINLNRILFATDFSDSATRARAMAFELAARFGAQLHLLHVIHDMAVEVPEFGMGLDFSSLVGNLAGHRHELKQKAVECLRADVDVHSEARLDVVAETRFGKPFVEIIRYAREHDIDLIVVGSHGRSGLTHVLLGSVAESVVRKSPCPVLTIRPIARHSDSGGEQELPPGVHPLPVG